ncbi:MAG: substrate-binding domain-containing protein [Lentisphaeria bacterium]|nr:substrate-binding domain-containing protein [Lentisphaeria bacterium]
MRLSDLPLITAATANLPKYRQIAAVLEEYLQRANLPEGERFFSDRALARRFSTTSVTVAHSLNYLVSKGLLSRRAGSGTYVGKNLPNRSSLRRIGIVCHEMICSDEFYSAPILRRFGAFFEKNNCECISFKSDPADWRRLLAEYQLDGLMVFVPKESFAGDLQKLRSENIPVVSVGYAMPELPSVSFGTNHAETVSMAVDYMYKLGHRQIALFYSKFQASSSVFERSYRQSMWEHQLPLNPMWEITMPYSDNSDKMLLEYDEIKNHWLKLKETNNMPTAVLVQNFFDAVSFYNFASQHNLRIPDDISLIAFDDPPFASQLNPPLTVISQDLECIADCAAQTLLDMIESRFSPGSAEQPKTLLVERGSCKIYK